MPGRKSWPRTKDDRETLRRIHFWRRESKATAETNFTRGTRVSWSEIARRLNELASAEPGLWLAPSGQWTARAVAYQAHKDDTEPPKRPPKLYLKPNEYLTYRQIDRCRGCCPPRDRLIFDFLILTGLRPGCEFAKLENRDLQFTLAGPVIHVRQGKRKKERFVKISKLLARRIQGRKQKGGAGGPMFPDCLGGALTRNGLAKRLKKIGQAAEIEPLYPYRLRHTFGTILYDQSKDLLNVAEQMGHANVNTSRIYAKVLDKTSSEYAEALQKRLDGTGQALERSIE